MKLKVFWADEAIETFDSIVSFIENKWNEKQAAIFVKRAQKIVLLIAHQPYMYKVSIDTNVRQAIISPQTSMYYEIHDEFNTIILLG